MRPDHASRAKLKHNTVWPDVVLSHYHDGRCARIVTTDLASIELNNASLI